MGFDDLPVAEWVGPPMTTVRQPLKDMSAAKQVVDGTATWPAQTGSSLQRARRPRETAPPAG